MKNESPDKIYQDRRAALHSVNYNGVAFIMLINVPCTVEQISCNASRVQDHFCSLSVHHAKEKDVFGSNVNFFCSFLLATKYQSWFVSNSNIQYNTFQKFGSCHSSLIDLSCAKIINPLTNVEKLLPDENNK